MTSTLSAVVSSKESEVAADIGRPARLTMFNVFPSIKTAMPRHVPWTMFPLVSEPYFEYKAVENDFHGRANKIFPDPGPALTEPAEIIERFEVLALEPESFHYGPLGMNDHLLRLGKMLESFSTDKQTIFVRATGWADPETEEVALGGNPNCMITFTHHRFRQTTVDEILRRVRPYGILMYSYRINFQAIAMKALRAARVGYGKPDIIDHIDGVHQSTKKRGWKRPAHKYDYNHYWRVFPHIVDGWKALNDGLVPDGLDHPFALQLLYALRKIGPISCSDGLNSWDGHHHLFQALLPRIEDSHSATWHGTDKYAPLEYGGDKRIEASLIASGLVDIDQQTLTLSINEIGQRFLDYLHPSCEDPDVILRWMGPDGFFKAGTEDSVEEWVTTHFRKMKTRVNLIPSELTEHVPLDRSPNYGEDDYDFD
ncbi:hypothetical protein [Rhizobium sp. BK176]|uniref:hypothetical protein n=1 Tax=Rhizobium sp. BK176 TaxID=2587071 RepID=UPI002169BAD3|nr:hypothetical protein [Rhizobium sp. BK176]MCS4088772.1 hypothetical protein [Rhizobium sp. BK176]